MVTLGLGCKVNCADSDFDLSEKNVGHDLLHKVSVIMVEMEILNGWHIVVSCLGLRHEDQVWGAKPNSTAPLLPIYFLLIYKGFCMSTKSYRAEFLLKVDFDVSDIELSRDSIFEMFFQALNLERFVFNGIEVKPKTFRGEGHINERPEDLFSLDDEDMIEV